MLALHQAPHEKVCKQTFMVDGIFDMGIAETLTVLSFFIRAQMYDFVQLQDQHLHNFFSHCQKMELGTTAAIDFEATNKLKVSMYLFRRSPFCLNFIPCLNWLLCVSCLSFAQKQEWDTYWLQSLCSCSRALSFPNKEMKPKMSNTCTSIGLQDCLPISILTFPSKS